MDARRNRPAQQRRRRLHRAPVVLENRVEHLVQALAVVHERLAQHALLNCAHLEERAVASAVEHRRTRFEPVRTKRVERELDDELCALHEYARAPEGRAERETPFGGGEARIVLAQLKDPDRRIESLKRDGVADVAAGGSLTMRPRDEQLEAL